MIEGNKYTLASELPALGKLIYQPLRLTFFKSIQNESAEDGQIFSRLA